MIPNFVWCLLLLAMLAAATVLVYRFARRTFLLILCHNLVWAGALVLIATNLIAYKTAKPVAWLTLATGLVAFNLGAWLISSILDRRGKPIAPRRRAGWLSVNTSFAATRGVYYAAFALYCVGFAVYLASIQVRFGITTLLFHPAVIRGAHGESYLESVPLPARLLLYLGPLLFVFLVYRPAIDKSFPVVVRVLGAVALAASMLALLQRTNIFLAILLWCAALVSQEWRVQRDEGRVEGRRNLRQRWNGLPVAWRVGGGFVALGLAALLVFQGVGGALNKTGQESLRSGAVASALGRSGLVAPFQYYTAGTMAFLQLAGSDNQDAPPERVRGTFVIGDWNPQTWGASTFSSVLKVLPGVPHVDPISPFIDTGVPTNVFTWLEPFYRDFRLPGVLVATAAMGAGFGWLFIRRFRSQTVFWISCVCITTVFLAPFVTRINSTLVISLIIYAAVITLASRWLTHRTVVIEATGKNEIPL
ncbi:hypothetical protein ACIRCZ_16735 [Leifsonia sp. NPDC102414]|uniref:hypothetical protein n=1 Tax=Leifsonia sp. NPDC102414 TaxID=3364124 RepID=UPI003819A887